MARWAPLAVVVALAGCAAPATVHDAPAVPERLTDDLRTCDDTTLLVYPEIERVQALLPPGLVALDAAGWPLVSSSPVPSGRGMVSITVITCERSALDEGPLGWAGNYILVERPDPPSDAVDDNGTAAYLAALYTSSHAHLTWAGPRGHHLLRAHVSNTAPSASAGLVSFEVADEEGTVARMEGVVSGSISFPEGRSSNWQVTPQGVLHHNVIYGDRDFAAGDAVSCSVREGSRMHELLGSTSCEGLPTLLFVATADPYEIVWTYLPDATLDRTRG